MKQPPQVGEPRLVQLDGGKCSVMVHAFDAHHCAGAVQFLFEGEWGRVLHTGAGPKGAAPRRGGLHRTPNHDRARLRRPAGRPAPFQPPSPFASTPTAAGGCSDGLAVAWWWPLR